MKIYWDNHNIFDVVAAALATFLMWKAGSCLPSPLFLFDFVQIKSSSLDISGILAGLLGLISAVIAFSFSAIELSEFRFLKNGASERQFWQIFASNIFYITLSIFFFISIYLMNEEYLKGNSLGYASSLMVILLLINLVKFSWLIYQMVSVKRDQAGLR